MESIPRGMRIGEGKKAVFRDERGQAVIGWIHPVYNLDTEINLLGFPGHEVVSLMEAHDDFEIDKEARRVGWK